MANKLPAKKGWDVFILQAGTTIISEAGSVLVAAPGSSVGQPAVNTPVIEPEMAPPEDTPDDGAAGGVGTRSFATEELLDSILADAFAAGATLVPVGRNGVHR